MDSLPTRRRGAGRDCYAGSPLPRLPAGAIVLDYFASSQSRSISKCSSMSMPMRATLFFR
jgi:hypothetical protein